MGDSGELVVEVALSKPMSSADKEKAARTRFDVHWSSCWASSLKLAIPSVDAAIWSEKRPNISHPSRMTSSSVSLTVPGWEGSV